MVISDKKKYQEYYTKSLPIIKYMVDKLIIENNDLILEPCGGDGVFIDEILNSEKDIKIDIFELNPNSIKKLNEKYNNFKNIKINQDDTLLNSDLLFYSNFGGIYDKIIANPPYGAWQDYDKRNDLKKIYNNLYVKESYSVFLYLCINLLKNNGLLSFIIPDTYLNLHMHKYLRKCILTKTKIIEILLFPSSFFPGVNFGYANLSIISLKKCLNQEDCLNNNFFIRNNFNNVNDLLSIDQNDKNKNLMNQNIIFKLSDHSFIINKDEKITNIIRKTNTTVGDVANCVTGFYSGNDKLFLKTIPNEHKNANKYDIINQNLINNDFINIPNILDGIDDKKYFIPIIKGGNIKYLKKDKWFINWSKETILHYKTDKKARFQNSSYYFKYGIAVPMVSSTQITASIIENKIFDQSIVGVFPKDIKLTYYLLAFFNTKTCNKIIRTINPSANNSANYIKKIPFIEPSIDSLENINYLVKNIIDNLKISDYDFSQIDEEINNYYAKIYGF